MIKVLNQVKNNSKASFLFDINPINNHYKSICVLIYDYYQFFFAKQITFGMVLNLMQKYVKEL